MSAVTALRDYQNQPLPECGGSDIARILFPNAMRVSLALAGAGGDLSAATQQLQSQTEAIHDLVAATEQIAGANAAISIKLSGISERMDSAVRQVAVSTSTVVHGIGGARQDISELARTASELDEQVAGASRRMSDLNKSLTGIQNIAREIQLLAVNAGVEAARHGASGRGFAVIAALSAGAVVFIEKPNSIDVSVETFRESLLRTLRVSARAGQPLARVAPRLAAAVQPASAPGKLLPDRVIAIGASTGGVAAIERVLIGLGDLALPVLITQHMPAGYTRRFAERLQQVTAFAVKEAEDGDELVPGRALIAPGNRHLTFMAGEGGAICRLDDGPPVSGHRPSVDAMFAAVAERIGRRAVGVLLTGMGRDGAEGLLAMRRAGSRTVVECEQTAVVFGMPKAALELQAADRDLPLPVIPNWILGTVSDQPAPRPPVVPAPARPAGSKDLRTKPIPAFRVLVVDDQKSMRGLAAHSLKQLGFNAVDEAESGEAALAAMRGADYDLLLADWNMEGMSGLDLLKAVRRERDQKQIVVVMTTSENHVSKVSEAMAAGANNYLVKPCDPPKLRQRLERALMRPLAG